MKNIVTKNIKDLFQIYFVLKIFVDNKYNDDLMQIYFESE